MARLAIFTVGAILAASGCMVQAAALQSDAQAREALADLRYSDVVALYKSAAPDDLSPAANYRMAIALSRLNNAVKAYPHLLKAIEGNPSLRFASDPSRVHQLRTDILLACEKAGKPDCVDAPVIRPPTPKEPEPQVDRTVSCEPRGTRIGNPQPWPLAIETCQNIATAETATPPATVAPQPSIPAVLGASGVAAKPTDGQNDLSSIFQKKNENLMFVPVICLSFLLMALAARIWLLQRRLARARTPSLLTLRDDVAKYLVILQKASCTNTVLYKKLADVLPTLELESGRSEFRQSGKRGNLAAPDAATIETLRKLQSAPLDIGSASPDEIKLAFQGPRWS